MFLTDNWKKINTDPVCFGTKNDDFGSFEIQEAGKIYTFKLVHTNGTVTCNTDYVRINKVGMFTPRFGTSYTTDGDNLPQQDCSSAC